MAGVLQPPASTGVASTDAAGPTAAAQHDDSGLYDQHWGANRSAVGGSHPPNEGQRHAPRKGGTYS